jgi:hypothetical protein
MDHGPNVAQRPAARALEHAALRPSTTGRTAGISTRRPGIDFVHQDVWPLFIISIAAALEPLGG